jgi:iron complex outermembrane receptor protein
MIRNGICCFAAMSAAAGALTAAAAFAQTPGAQPSVENDPSAIALEEIIVTGTLIRGTDAPVGANVIALGEGDVIATGATTTAQLLQTIPQLGSFNDLQFPIGFGNTVTVNRPNLRSLPGADSAGGSTTLVLMNGHRIVGAGINSTTPDPDIIPPGAIERLEIVPDGGSAIYGSDAVAGVMNFVTRRKFDGVKVDGRYGFADDYYQTDVNLTAGRDWGSGGLYASYSYAEHDSLFGKDRDYVRQFPRVSDGFTSLNCNPGTVQVGSNYYGLPFTTATAVAGTEHECDESDDQSFYPSEHRHSAFAGYAQDLTDAMRFDVQGFYTERKTELSGGPFKPQAAVTVQATHPGLASSSALGNLAAHGLQARAHERTTRNIG